MDATFEWDAEKAASNLRKHGIGFDYAVSAFSDPLAIEIADARQDYGETRILLIGRAGRDLLAVVYTERGANIRIISVRRATRHERQFYQRQNAP